MGRRNNYKGWDNRADAQGNAFGGGHPSIARDRGGQHNSQNAFSLRGAPSQARQNAFSALAEPSQHRSSQNSIAQRVSYPAAQRNAFSAAPANAFGGASSTQSNFHPAALSPRQQPSSTMGRSSNAFNSNRRAFGNNAFSGTHTFGSSQTNGFGGAAATPQQTGFGVGNSQQRMNAFSGAHMPQQAAFAQPQAPQPTVNTSSGFNAFSSSQQPPVPSTGFHGTMAVGPASTANAFAGRSGAPQPPSRAQPSNAFDTSQMSRQQHGFNTGFGGGFGAVGASCQAHVGSSAGFGSQLDRRSIPPGPPAAGTMNIGAVHTRAEQPPVTEAEQKAWMSDRFEKLMVPEVPPPAAVC